MKTLAIKPDNFDCTLAEAPVGPFVDMATGILGIKSNQPHPTDGTHALCLGADGNFFTAGTSSLAERDARQVYPCAVEETGF